MAPPSNGLIIFGTILTIGLLTYLIWLPKNDNKVEQKNSSIRIGSRNLNVLDPKTVEVKGSPNFLDQALVSEVTSEIQPLYDPNEPDPWKKGLFQRLDRIRATCGPLCSINDRATFDKFVGPQTRKTTFDAELKVPGVQCDKIMLDEDVDASDSSLPFPPPDELGPYFSMNGMVQYHPLESQLNNIYLDGDQTMSSVWTEELINGYIENCKDPSKDPYAGYGKETRAFMESIRKYTDISEGGKRVLVLGSEVPWVEAIALYLGAEHVTTLEYGKINNQHPKLTTMIPSEFRQNYKDGKIEPFDIILSFSSVEHTGLGRYGDALNPWGDILAIARARCVTKVGGYLALVVPTHKQYNDFLYFNAHRLYGRNRYPLLTANWEQVDAEDHPGSLQTYMEQPTFVFRNEGN